MAKQESMTLLDFQGKFFNDEVCREHLFKMRWGNGYQCPQCGHGEYGYQAKRRVYQCKKCGHQASVIAGTILENTKLPLYKWFWAIFMVSRDKRGVSAVRIQHELSISYPSAWLMLHKIRKGMGDRDKDYQLAGIVELDDTYFGAPAHDGKRGRGTEKTSVLVALSLEEEGKKAGYAKMEMIKDLKSETLAEFADRNIAEGSTISSDAYSSYMKAFAEGKFKHEAKKFHKEDGEHLKWLHTIVSNAKSFIQGTYHGLADTHFQAYLDEYCYRLNRRGVASELFNRLVCACVFTCTVTRNALYGRLATETG